MKVRLPLQDAADLATLPDGRYQLRVVSVEMGETQKGDQALRFQYLVVAPSEVKGVRVKGRKITKLYGFNEYGLAELRSALEALLQREIPRKAVDIDTDRLVGKECVVDIGTQNGYLRFRNYRPVSAEEAEGDEDDEE